MFQGYGGKKKPDRVLPLSLSVQCEPKASNIGMQDAKLKQNNAKTGRSKAGLK